MFQVLICTNMKTIDNDIPLVYIEYTNEQLWQRKHYHFYNSQLDEPKHPFHLALKHIGAQFFKWDIVEQAYTEKEAIELTKYYKIEYKADIIGYNKEITEELAGKNNPRYGDHRTWEEIHGKEKADKMKIANTVKDPATMKKLSDHMKRRLEIWNPMQDPAAREKVKLSKLGTKNPKSIYNYILTKNDETITIECIREFCRNNKNFKKNGLLWAIRNNKPYKGYKIEKVYKKDKK